MTFITTIWHNACQMWCILQVSCFSGCNISSLVFAHAKHKQENIKTFVSAVIIGTCIYSWRSFQNFTFITLVESLRMIKRFLQRTMKVKYVEFLYYWFILQNSSKIRIVYIQRCLHEGSIWIAINAVIKWT